MTCLKLQNLFYRFFFLYTFSMVLILIVIFYLYEMIFLLSYTFKGKKLTFKEIAHYQLIHCF